VVALLGASLASAAHVFDMQEKFEKVMTHGQLLTETVKVASSGAVVEEKTYERHIERTISFAQDPNKEFHMTNWIENMTKQIAEHKEKMKMANSNTPLYTCGDREPDGKEHDAGAFFPTFAGEITAQ
jgi:hypothetical protein